LADEIVMNEPNNTLVHFYRATVMHADIWRQRLDATTNWAVVTTAGLTSFAFATPAHPHFMLLIAFAFNMFFLVMESRRYQVYDLWRDRIRRMNHWIVAPQLDPNHPWDNEEVATELARLARDLGSTLPLMTLLEAIGYRIRRNYGFITFMVSGAWLLKLYVHPGLAVSLDEFVNRAQTGVIPGSLLLGIVLGILGVIAFLGLKAPTERMAGWIPQKSPLDILLRK